MYYVTNFVRSGELGNIFLQRVGHPVIRNKTRILQINLGKICNQVCRHCHVGAGPHRTEQLADSDVEACFHLMERLPDLQIVDLTGGAPELHPRFRDLVDGARRRGLQVIDRCNLTILEEEGQEDLALFLAEKCVHVIASLPCYEQKNVDRQRGSGVFEKSISALRQLNALGYGMSEGEGAAEGFSEKCSLEKSLEGPLRLDLVFNPQGANLPPSQKVLEASYRDLLKRDYDIIFDHLITITNMPIARFLDQLRAEGSEESYRQLLQSSYNPDTLNGLMCRDTLSIDHEGHLHDCDFNQMLDMRLKDPHSGDVLHVSSAEEKNLRGREVETGDHCFGCTAGVGSSCGGGLVSTPAAEESKSISSE